MTLHLIQHYKNEVNIFGFFLQWWVWYLDGMIPDDDRAKATRKLCVPINEN